jgi:protein CrcB
MRESFQKGDSRHQIAQMFGRNISPLERIRPRPAEYDRLSVIVRASAFPSLQLPCNKLFSRTDASGNPSLPLPSAPPWAHCCAGCWASSSILFFLRFPPSTLAVIQIGGYAIGLAIAFFSALPSRAPEWRLLVITGFCGGLTTFSTFSAEIATPLQQGRPSWALGAVAVHVLARC